MSLGRFGDWREHRYLECYHPSHDDYQEKGNCRRWTAKCLNIGTRARLISEKDIFQAFKEAKFGHPIIVSFANHDYRNMEEDITMYIKNSCCFKKFLRLNLFFRSKRRNEEES